MTISRRSLLKGIAASPVVAALAPDILKPIITGLDKAAPGADITVHTVGWVDHGARVGTTIAPELMPGINAMFKAEYYRLGYDWREVFNA